MAVLTYYPEDTKILQWLGYYYNPQNPSEYTKYDSNITPWEQWPSAGVLVIVRIYLNEDGSKRIERFNGHECYMKDWATEDLIRTNKRVGDLIKFGIYISDDEFHPLFDKIKLDIEKIT